MRVSIGKFQELHDIAKTDIPDVDKATAFVVTLTGKDPREVERLSPEKISAKIQKISKLFDMAYGKNLNKGRPGKEIRAGGRTYVLYYNVKEKPFNAARYVEIATFSRDPIKNLDKILASIASPKRTGLRRLFPRLFRKELSHEQLADLIREGVEFGLGYRSAFFFLSEFQRFNRQFTALFKADDDEDGGGSSVLAKDFAADFGWIYSATLVAEMERTTLEAVWDLPVIHFLNDLLYVKKKRELDRDLDREALRKAKMYGKG